MPYRTRSVTSTEAGITLAEQDSRRKSLSIFNTTTGRVSILDGGIGRAETEGFPVNSSGGNLTFNENSGSDPKAKYFIKSAAAAGDLVIRVIEEW